MTKRLNRRSFVKSGAGILALAGVAKISALPIEDSASTNKHYTPGKNRMTVRIDNGNGSTKGDNPSPASTNIDQGPDAASTNPPPAPAPTNAPPVQPAPAPVRKLRNIKKAILYSGVPGDLPLADKFKMAKDAGFQGVKLMGNMDQAEVLGARYITQLEIPGVWDEVQSTKPLSDPSPSVRDAGIEGLKTALRDCKAYGGASVSIIPAVVNRRVSYADAYERSHDEIQNVIPFAKNLGVKISIANAWNDFLMSPLETKNYIDDFKSETVGCCLDVGEIAAWGWPEQWIRILGKRIHTLHFKEFSREKSDNEGRRKGLQVDYLNGDVNWPAVMKALDEIEFSGWVIAEPAYRPTSLSDAGFLKHVRERIDGILGM